MGWYGFKLVGRAHLEEDDPPYPSTRPHPSPLPLHFLCTPHLSGKFYELFEEDALLCHRELDLAFMGKGAPHVGFPESSLRKYSDKLVAMGHKVGVVEG